MRQTHAHGDDGLPLFAAPVPQSLTDRLEQFFRARPGEWIDGRQLGTFAGAYAWRSRVSDVRRRGLRIDNRVRTLHEPDGRAWKVSEYRYTPIGLDQQGAA